MNTSTNGGLRFREWVLLLRHHSSEARVCGVMGFSERNEGLCFNSICRNMGFVLYVPNFTSLVRCLLIWRERKRKMRKDPNFRMRSMYGTQYIVPGFEKLRTFV